MSRPSGPQDAIGPSRASLDFLMLAIGAELSGLDSGRRSATECKDRIAVLVQAGLALIELDREPRRSRTVPS
jgi:hypothetical protein